MNAVINDGHLRKQERMRELPDDAIEVTVVDLTDKKKRSASQITADMQQMLNPVGRARALGRRRRPPI